MKRTFQPSNLVRKRRHGFRSRMATVGGRKVLNTRRARVRKRSDFLAANRGKRAPMPGFVLLVRPRGDDDPTMRIGITVTKKIGNAVVRNRMKRRFRALARETLPELGIAGADHVLIGRAGGIERDYASLVAELKRALKKVAAA